MFFRKRTLEKGETHSNYYDYFIPAVTTKEEEDLFFHSYIKPIYDELDSAKSKLLNNSNNQSKYNFEARITKLLFDIKRNPKTSEFYGKCNAYYYKYQTQVKPEGMDDKTWEKTRITAPKVVAYLKQHLQKQNPKKFVPKGTIVKTKYAIKEAKVPMSSRDIFRLVYADEYYFEDRKYAKLIQRKNKEMLNQMQDFDTMQLDDSITTFLKSVPLKGFDNGVEVDIALNDIQLEDTNKILQKRYGYLQWEQGAGKTVSGLAQIKYRKEMQGVKKTIIVGPSIAINGTWIDVLRINKLKNLNISSMKDVYEMMSDDYDTVTMSFYYLGKYQKQIKKALKGKRYFFLLDEADSFSNPSSQRTKSGLDLFRRAAYKTLMSGTSIRNNIAEFYPQLELLYNNSYNMVDECRFVYKQDQKTKDIVSDINKSQDYPFAPYKKGFNEFKSCFNPSKVSVFGVNKQDQKVYNSDSLADILSYTVITRTFEEVTGKKIYKVSPMHIEANNDELQLQETIKRELHSFYGVYINSTGNSRKDAMLRLLHQMNLLFQSCSNPKSFREYKNETFSKWETVKEYLNSNQDHAVIAGVHKSEMYRYRALIQMTYPEKTIFYIDGEISIKKRKEIIATMGKTKNSVLVCTQQSLSSSISINFIDTVLLTSLDWNLSKMSQFYFRFIRYNSKGFKNVHLLTLKGSIESNLLKVVLDKDNLVNYMKTRKMSNENKMEVDIDFLLSLMVSKDELSEKKEAA